MVSATKFISLALLLTLNHACIKNQSSRKEGNQYALVNTLQADTLQFTSGVRAIFQDSKGNYWFGSHTEGVSYFDGKSFQYFTTREGLADNQVRSIQEDTNGNIWFGTARGVSVYDKGKFTNYPAKSNSPIVDWNETRGDLWFNAIQDEGVNRFDGTNMNYLLFPKPASQNAANSYGVTEVTKDPDGKIWIATYAALFSYDGTTVDAFDDHHFNLNGHEQLHIRSVLADSKGRIWIGNNGIGVILMSGDSTVHFSKVQGKLIPIDAFIFNTQHQQTSKHTGLQSVFAIEEDAEGNIWFGDRDSGAWRYDGASLTNFTVDEKFKSKMIWDIYLDNNDNLLFGMAEGGVYRFNGRSFERAF